MLLAFIIGENGGYNNVKCSNMERIKETTYTITG